MTDGEHAPSEWDSFAADWDTDAAARSYAAAAFGSLDLLLRGSGRSLDGANVIDFGAGTGLLTERLVDAGARVHAVDTSTAMLDVVRAKSDAHGWTDVHISTDLPSDESGTDATDFDLVVCSSVCSFLDDYPGTVARLCQLLRPGGRFVQWDWERTAADEHGLSRTEIMSALESAGLSEVSVDVGFEVAVEDDVMRPLMGQGRVP